MKKYKILYVEDEQTTRQNHILYLKDNFEVDIYEANDGVEGYQSYIKNKPDIIITDITMPNMCGLELIQKIREKDSEVKIIVFSAYSDQEKLLKAIQLNLIEYKIKPIKREDLRNVITKAIKLLNDYNLFYFNSKSYFHTLSEELIIDDKIVKFSKKEVELLKYLILKKNSVVDTVDIFNIIWDFSKEYNIDSVRALIKKLRKKLPLNSIENIYGGRYRLKII